LAELFTEQPLFTLTQMLDYRNGVYDPMPIVNKIVDVDIRVNIYIFINKHFFFGVGLLRQWLQV
jgi:hypothetical protein